MKMKLKSLFRMAAAALLLYYFYRCITDGEFFGQVFIEHSYPLARVAADVTVCVLLTWLSVVYSTAMVRLMNVHGNVQRAIGICTMVLFVLDMLTAWGISELCSLLFDDGNVVTFFMNFFVFGLLATLMSAINTTSLLLEKKMAVERERAIARLHNLQSQVDPHFFFNNLSALSALISTDTALAKDFVNALSRMYRHVLAGLRQDIVPLREELQLVSEYSKLIHIRHGESVTIDMPGEDSIPPYAFVPPSSVLHLVENAIKHNAMSPLVPLHIKVACDEVRVCVSNGKKPLAGAEARSGTGLANLREQLRLLGADDIRKCDGETSFSVDFPLIFKDGVY